jgi:hypothetical protein
MRLCLTLVSLGALVATGGWAQPHVPTALLSSVHDVDSVDAVDFAALDLAAIAAEDAEREAADLPPRFAIARRVSITPEMRGTWEEIDGGRLLWRLRLRAEEAASLNLGFTRYRMPPEGQLFLYAADLTDQIRPFTAADNHPDGQLWTPILPTSDLVVEVTIPRGRRGELELELGQVGQGYRAVGFVDAPLSGACNMDVECLLGADPWRDNVRAVGAITLGGTDNCSGSLLNNTAQDRKMYFMTANHCGIDAGDAGTVVVYWNFQNSTCRTPGSAASGQAGDGQRNQFASGWTFRAARSASDFTLIEYLGTVDSAWQLYWAGWDRSIGDTDCSGQPCFACSDSNLCAAVHHPGVDEKRITFVEDAMVHSVYGGGTVPPPGNDDSHLWVKWDPDPVFPPSPATTIPPQVTEPGSSGSPVYSSARRFLGQLHGGPSACGSTGLQLSDYYGFLNMSWAAGGTAATQAKNWLDPGDTGATTLDGANACTPTGAPTGLTATPNGDNRIDLAWSAVAGAESYKVYRALGACPGSGSSYLGTTAATTYSDLTVSGGLTYSYQVTAIDADADDCESVKGNCDDAPATGSCLLAPAFTGLQVAESTAVSACGVDLAWGAGSSSCGGGVVYNVYRSTDSGFVPGAANLLQGCVAGTFYQDTSAVYGTTYYYAVRAEDQTGDGAGLCASGNEEQNVVRKLAAPGGADQAVFADDVEGTTALWTVDGSGAGAAFAVSTAAAHSPTHAWFVVDPDDPADWRLATAAAIALPASPPATLEFWHRYNTESNWDGGVLETSTDGTNWLDILNGNAARFIAGGYTGALNSSANPLGGRSAWNGDIASFARVEVDLADFAGQSRFFRWRFGADASVADTGWYVDDVRVLVPTACSAGLLFADDFEAGASWRWSAVVPGV